MTSLALINPLSYCWQSFLPYVDIDVDIDVEVNDEKVLRDDLRTVP